MARKTQVILTDDVDGSEATQTVSFALDGVAYEIDLNDSHAEQLESSSGPGSPVAAVSEDGALPARGAPAGATRSGPRGFVSGRGRTATRPATADASPPPSSRPTTQPTDAPYVARLAGNSFSTLPAKMQSSSRPSWSRPFPTVAL